jgi:PPM family protein phosphatase
MRLVSWGQTDVGRVRDHNEDSLVLDAPRSFFMVADGVGGGAAGEVASRTAVEIVHKRVSEYIDRLGQPAMSGSHPAAPQIQGETRTCLDRAINEACEAIYTRSQNEIRCRGMATTAVALQVLGNSGVIGHVGDSRLFMVRQGQIYQVTEDHTLVQQLLQTGVLTPQEARDFPHKSVLARSVGKHPAVKVDTMVVDIAPGDRFVLCSDGLSDLVDSQEIRRVVEQSAPQEAAAALVEMANRAGGRDNISVIIVEARGDAPRAKRLRTEHKAELLSNVFLFRDLTFQETMRVLAVVGEVYVDDGQAILREGDSGDDFFVLVSGEAVVSKNGVALTTIRTGGHFGELALLGDGVRSASVTARGKCVLLRITKQDFYSLVSTDHGLSLKLLWGFLQNVAGRMKNLSADVTQLRAQRGPR